MLRSTLRHCVGECDEAGAAQSVLRARRRRRPRPRILVRGVMEYWALSESLRDRVEEIVGAGFGPP